MTNSGIGTDTFLNQLQELYATRDPAYVAGYLESVASAMFQQLPRGAQLRVLAQFEKTNSEARVARARAN